MKKNIINFKNKKIKRIGISFVGITWIGSVVSGIVAVSLKTNNINSVKHDTKIKIGDTDPKGGKDDSDIKSSLSKKSKDLMNIKKFGFLINDTNTKRNSVIYDKNDSFYYLEKDYNSKDFIYILKNVESRDNYQIDLKKVENNVSKPISQIFSWDINRFLSNISFKNDDGKEIKLFLEWIQDTITKKWSLILKNVEKDNFSANNSLIFNLTIKELSTDEIKLENELREKLIKLDTIFFHTIVNKNLLPSEVAIDPTTKERIKKLVCVNRIKDYEINFKSNDEFGYLYINIVNHGSFTPIKLTEFQTSYEKEILIQDNNFQKFINSTAGTTKINDLFNKSLKPSDLLKNNALKNAILAIPELNMIKTNDVILIPNDEKGTVEIIFTNHGDDKNLIINDLSSISGSTATQTVNDKITAINNLTPQLFDQIQFLHKTPSEIVTNYKNIIKSFIGLDFLQDDNITLNGDDVNGILEIKINYNNVDKILNITGLETKKSKQRRKDLLAKLNSLSIPVKIQVFSTAEDKGSNIYDTALANIKQDRIDAESTYDNDIMENKISMIKANIAKMVKYNTDQIKTNFEFQLNTLGNGEKKASHILPDLKNMIINFKDIGTPIKKEDIEIISSNDITGELKIKIKNFKNSQEFILPNVLTAMEWKNIITAIIKDTYVSFFRDSAGRVWLAQKDDRLKVLKPNSYYWEDVPGDAFENGEDSDFFEDSQGNIWLSAFNKPTYVLFTGEEKWQTTSFKNNPTSVVRTEYSGEIFEDSQGNLWTTESALVNHHTIMQQGFSSQISSILRWIPSEKAWENFIPGKEVSSDSVFGEDWAGNIYIITGETMNKINIDEHTITPLDKSSGNKITNGWGATMWSTSNKDLYAMGNNYGIDAPLQVLKNGKTKWEDANGSTISDGQYSLHFEDSDGNIWAAGVRSKLFVLRKGKEEWEEAGHESKLKDGKFGVMFEDSQKTLWVLGRDSQLQFKKHNEDEWQDYAVKVVKHNLKLDDNVSKNKPIFFEDKDGRLWVWIQKQGIIVL